MPFIDKSDWLLVQSIVEYSLEALDNAEDVAVEELKDTWNKVLRHLESREKQSGEEKEIDILLEFFARKEAKHEDA